MFRFRLLLLLLLLFVCLFVFGVVVCWGFLGLLLFLFFFWSGKIRVPICLFTILYQGYNYRIIMTTVKDRLNFAVEETSYVTGRVKRFFSVCLYQGRSIVQSTYVQFSTKATRIIALRVLCVFLNLLYDFYVLVLSG